MTHVMVCSLSRANASCILHTCMEIQPRFQITALSASTTERFLHNVNVQNPGRHARAWGAFVYRRRGEQKSYSSSISSSASLHMTVHARCKGSSLNCLGRNIFFLFPSQLVNTKLFDCNIRDTKAVLSR